MSGWIKFWKDMPVDPRIMKAAYALAARLQIKFQKDGTKMSRPEAIGLARNAIVGAMATLWCYADEHIHEDDSLPVSSETLDAIVGLEGFVALMPNEWVIEAHDAEAVRIILPGYGEKNSLIVKKKRALKAKDRMSRARFVRANGAESSHSVRNNITNVRSEFTQQDIDRDKDSKNSSETLTSPDPDTQHSNPTAVARPTVEMTVGPVERIFGHWRAEYAHPNAVLSAKRRQITLAALKLFDEPTLKLAISGYKNSAHHMGQNEQATVYDGFELFLRDVPHIEAGLQFAQRGATLPLSQVELVRQHLQNSIRGINGHGELEPERSGEDPDEGSLGATAGLFR